MSYQIRIYKGEFLIGKLNHCACLFTCYDYFQTMKEAVQAIKAYTTRYDVIQEGV